MSLTCWSIIVLLWHTSAAEQAHALVTTDAFACCIAATTAGTTESNALWLRGWLHIFSVSICTFVLVKQVN